ncbi:uncharacterized protein LOC125764558 [Anopheles funestus]|uniref:uncharacterized protein LOC125764558 n=1 Tax=Anopheles funestus TaxID=62324 RepID=UPI0020C6D071|nr:uncharacterized protein LOC125764558 [Anopheles funestus]
MLNVWLLFVIAVVSIKGIEVIFERIEQLSGFDMFHHTLRVRKYNATTSVLNGSLASCISLNNSYQISTIFFHSSLGNQQFNYYPIKYPPGPLCVSRDLLYNEFRKSFTNVYNLPEKGVCPIEPREIYFLDKIFPTEVVPTFVSVGLWKVFIIVTLDNVEVSRFVLICKVNKYF